jgi:cytochrome c oxidase assembly protein subunit 11
MTPAPTTPGSPPSPPAERADARRAHQQRANRMLLTRFVVVVAAMFGFGYLLVPFYNKICEVTGLRNIASADEPVNSQVDATREVRIELDTNVHNMPWQFRPLTPSLKVHPGEVTQVEFEVTNTTDHAVTGQAIPSYGPRYAAEYFRKLECFCFSQQTLAPRERRVMPVVFVIDPKAPRDLGTITLSYTFFEVEGNRKG